MESQVEKAVEIVYAWGPSSDQTLKAQAYDFLDQVRSEPQGWSACLPLVIRRPRASEVVRIFSLDVLNHAIQSQAIDAQSLVFIRDNLLQYVRSVYVTPAPGTDADQDPNSIQNKLSQTFTYLFTEMYASQWTTFFVDLLSLTHTADLNAFDNAAGIRLYLRTVGSIHDEIGDIYVARSPQEHQRDNNLKDLVRERDMQQITQSWTKILQQFKADEGAVIELCLKAIGKWSGWTDLSLIINDALLNLLFGLVYSGLSTQETQACRLRDVSLHTIMEILGKKMKGQDKLDLIDVLRLNEVVAALTSSTLLQELRFSPNYDTDLAELVAKLVNHTVLDIVHVLENTPLGDPVQSRADTQLKTFLPFVLRFFSDEYDEICSSVIPCLTDLLTFFRKRVGSNSDYTTTLPPILQAIVAKMKYDETSDWGSEDSQTDEAEFQELRKRLQVLQQAVAAVDESLYINTISTIVGTAFEAFQNNKARIGWRDVDLALHEMFLFGQLAVKNGGLYSKTKPVSPAAERLISMMFKLLECDIASFSHPAIHLQFMEICVRYTTFFEANPRTIPQVLERFVQFVHHDHIKVRTRSWYLFHRFVKQLRQHIGNVAETVIHAVADLLPIRAELPSEPSDDDDEMSSDENDQSEDAKFTSQLYLYEAVGNICSTHAVPVGSQVVYIQAVQNPLFSDLEAHLTPARNGDERAILQVRHVIMALGTLAHGFSEWAPSGASSFHEPAKDISEEFSRTAEAILVALESLSTSQEIRTASRAAFSRLFSVLGNRILPQLPRWIDGLLSRTSTKDEMALFLRLVDQVVYGFKTEIFDILNNLLTPFLQRVFAGMAEPTTGTDDEIQLSELKSQYLGFLLVILNNDLGRVLVSDENQPIFETLITTLEHFTKDTSDLSTSKLSFTVLTKMILTWGGPDVVVQGQTTTPANPQPSLPGFDRFIVERFSPLCWTVAGSATINPRDAQAKNVLGEAAIMQQAIYAKTGQEYLNWLQNSSSSGINLSEIVNEEYLQALSTLDARKFRQYFQNRIQQIRK